MTLVATALVLVLASPGSAGPSEADEEPLGDKTLIVWVSPANLSQRGGTALTVDANGIDRFDGIVFGEREARVWMAGSNGFTRTCLDQSDWPREDASPGEFVQMAIVYHGQRITLYRNGVLYARYSTDGRPYRFGPGSAVLFGPRHLANRRDCFEGRIRDARIYDRPLSQETISGLRPGEAITDGAEAGLRPWAWWDFAGSGTYERTGRFNEVRLGGEARIEEGCLVLAGDGATLLATRSVTDGSPVATTPERWSLGGPVPAAAIESSRLLREHQLADPYRPGFHFTVPEGRCMPFDPNGAIFWKGRYHLFYIFQDRRGHNWGHVSSTDLFHWRHHPTDLVDGMFSGNCFLDKEGRPTICYHQVGQGNAMAVALDDQLDRWQKLESNPITPRTGPGDPHHGRYRSWDPFGWVEGEHYYAIFGGKRAAVARSTSLDGEWNYVGDLLANTVDGVSIDEDISCAELFPLGDRHMLLCISHRLGCRYYLGDWRDGQFHPTSHQQMSWVDNSFFAPESLLDDRGRRIMWAWIFDGPGFETRMDAGWSGTMSLPRHLTLAADGTLQMNPPVEIERLRYNGKRKTGMTVQADTQLLVEGASGNSLELAVELVADNAREYGVKVCCSPGGEEQTLIYYDVDQGKLVVDARASSLAPGSKTIEAGPLELRPDEPLRLRIFVDRSVVEVFANGRQAVMRRIYPSRADSVGIALFANGGRMQATSFEAWEMMPSQPY